MPPEREMLADRPEAREKFCTRFGSRSPHMRRFYAVIKTLAKFATPASDGFVCDARIVLEEQFLDVAQTQLKAKISAHSTIDDSRWKTMTMTERFRFFHLAIL